jgi:hypothetical protein
MMDDINRIRIDRCKSILNYLFWKQSGTAKSHTIVDLLFYLLHENHQQLCSFRSPIPFYSIQPKMEKKKRQLRYDCGLVETGMRAQYGQKILRAKPSDTLLLVLVSSPWQWIGYE